MHCLQPGKEALGGGGLAAIAIGGGKDDDAFCIGQRRRVEACQRGGMHLLAGGAQRLVQRGRKAPCAATLAADQNDGLGPAKRRIALKARTAAAGGKPDQRAGGTHQRHTQCQKTEDQPQHSGTLAGVQHVDGFGQLLPAGQVLPGEQRAGALVDVA